jgi:hypothetical protein
MTEPQVWVLIGVFAAAIFGMFTIVSTLFLRILRAEVGSIRGEIGGLRAEMNGRFDKLEQRVDGIDRDVQALVKHTFGLDRG